MLSNKLQMCSVTHHQCRRRQIWGKVSQIHPVLSLFVSYKKWLALTEQSIHGNNYFNSLQCPLMLRTNNRIYSVTQHQFRRRQMWGKFPHIHPVHSLLSVTKNGLSWLNNLFMVMFQLMRMSSYAKNKLQMCSVTQHQCRRSQMRAKVSQVHTVHSLFICYKKWPVLTEQSIHGKVSTHWGCPLMLKNKLLMCSVTQHQFRRRQMWGTFSQIHPVHTLFVCYKKGLVLSEQSIQCVMFQDMRMSSYARNKTTDVFSHPTSV